VSKDRTKYHRDYNKGLKSIRFSPENHARLSKAFSLYSGPHNFGEFVAWLSETAVGEFIKKHTKN